MNEIWFLIIVMMIVAQTKEPPVACPGNYADVPRGITYLHQLNTIYHHAFQYYAGLCFILFPICLMLVPTIKNLLRSELNSELLFLPKHEKTDLTQATIV